MEEAQSERSYGFFEFGLKYLRTYLQFISKKPLKNRKDLPILLRILNLNGKGAEVGVLWGAYSKILIENSKLSTLYLIDPWMPVGSEEYNDPCNVSKDHYEERYQKVVRNFEPFGSRHQILRTTSEEASKIFEDGSLDFVYIDANHSYEAVQQDIQFWWPKVKAGGIMSGHDYYNERPDGKSGNYGVKRAVDEFASKYNQKTYVIKTDWPTWYIIKQII